MSDSSDLFQVLDLSTVSSDKAKEILGIRRYSYPEQTGLEEIFKFEESVPNELLEDAYNSLAKYCSSPKVYDYFAHINNKTSLIGSVMEIVVSHFIRKYNLKIDELEIQKERELQWPHGGRMLSAQIDYGVVLNGSESGRKKSHCFVVECCQYPSSSLYKCCLFLKGLKELGDDKKELYGIVCDQDDWILIRFQNDSFEYARNCYKNSFGQGLTRSPSSKNYKEWLKENSTIVKLLYSILHRELAPIYESAN